MNKKLEKKISALREEFRKRKANKPKLVCPVEWPRYDDVLLKALKTL